MACRSNHMVNGADRSDPDGRRRVGQSWRGNAPGRIARCGPTTPTFSSGRCLWSASSYFPILVWYLFNVVLIAFGAVVFAMLLWLGAEPFMRWLPLPEGVALLLSGVLVLLVLGTTEILFGTPSQNELQDVIQRVGSGAAGLQSYLETSAFGKLIAGHITGSSFSLTSVAASLLSVNPTLSRGSRSR